LGIGLASRKFEFRLHVTTLGKLFTHVCLCSPKGGDDLRQGR